MHAYSAADKLLGHAWCCVAVSACARWSSRVHILLISQGQPLEDSYEGVVVDFSSRWIRLALASTAAAAVSAAGPRDDLAAGPVRQHGDPPEVQ